MVDALNRRYTPLNVYENRFTESRKKLFYTKQGGTFNIQDLGPVMNGEYPAITAEKIGDFLEAGYHFHQKVLLDNTYSHKTINEKLKMRDLYQNALQLTLPEDKRSVFFDETKSVHAIHCIFDGILSSAWKRSEKHRKQNGLRVTNGGGITSTVSHMLLMPFHHTEFTVSADNLRKLRSDGWDKQRVYKFVCETWPIKD